MIPARLRYQRGAFAFLALMAELPAFLFPGQGSQRVGMGAALRAGDPRLFDSWMQRAEDACGLPIRSAVVEGPDAVLTATEIAQPALLALSLAVAEVAWSAGVQPRLVAGHSLGEYAAAVVAGVLDADDALRLVAERGRLMAAAQRKQKGAMGVVLGLPGTLVERACAQTRQRHGYVAVANLNSPQQVVVTGNLTSVEAALALAVRWGGRGGLLPVGGAFHSLLMATVEARLRRIADTLRWRDARVPLVSNRDGRVVTSGDAIRAALIAQTTQPVRWTNCMATMLEMGCRHFLELGPGRVLTGLARQHSSQVLAIAIDGPAKIAAYQERHAAALALEDRLAG